MKAREIKKALIQEREQIIKRYDEVKRRSILEMECEAVKLSQLNHILLNYFNVNTKYIDTTEKPEPEPLSGIERDESVPF
jgi:hypothetical protein